MKRWTDRVGRMGQLGRSSLPLAMVVLAAVLTMGAKGMCGVEEGGTAGQTTECADDSDCAAGQICSAAGKCVSDVDPPELCTSDEECPPGQACVDGACTSKVDPPPPGSCTGDEACAAGEHCNTSDGVCLPAPGCGEDMACPAVCYGYCVPDEPPVECLTDADCPGATTYCIDGVCTWVDPFCTSNADCGAGQICVDGMCTALPPLPCANDAQCPEGTQCISGLCVPVEPPPVGCFADSDCPDGFVCILPPCAPCWCDSADPADCDCAPCTGQCIPKTDPPLSCTSDADCPDGEQCVMGPCPSCACFDETDCGPCPPCDPIGQCVPKTEPPVGCLSDADCPAGHECLLPPCPGCDCVDDYPCNCPPCGGAGVCVPKTEPPVGCTSDADCAPGETCVFVPCWDWDCAEGEDCGAFAPCDPMGQCVPKTEPPLECMSDADCPKGEMCVFVPCADWSCPEDADCEAYYPCEPIGYCEPKTEPPTDLCMGDWECGKGEHCNAGEICLPGPYCSDSDGCPAVCYGYCVPDAEGCWSDDDCAFGYVCDFETCYDGICPPGVFCECAGTCVKKEPESCMVSGCSGEICADTLVDSDCAWHPWFVCLKYTKCGNFAADGSCGWLQTFEYQACMDEYGDPPPEGCTSDSDCAKGYFCDVGPCACGGWPGDPTGVCPPCTGECKPIEEEPIWCSSDADCPYGWTCDCVPSWGTGGPTWLIACEMQCVPPAETECYSDYDCAKGETCLALPCDWGCGGYGADPADPDGVPADAIWCPPCPGVCVPEEVPWECTSDADCGPGDVCVIEFCEGCVCPAGVDCDCDEWCWGTCQPKTEPPLECEVDSDCPDGYACELLYCYDAPCYFDEATGEAWCPPCFGQCVPIAPPPPRCA